MFVSAKGLTEGIYEVELELDLAEGLEQVGKVYVTVKVQPKETETETNTDETPSENASGDTTSPEQGETTTEDTTTGE